MGSVRASMLLPGRGTRFGSDQRVARTLLANEHQVIYEDVELVSHVLVLAELLTGGVSAVFRTDTRYGSERFRTVLLPRFNTGSCTSTEKSPL